MSFVRRKLLVTIATTTDVSREDPSKVVSGRVVTEYLRQGPNNSDKDRGKEQRRSHGFDKKMSNTDNMIDSGWNDFGFDLI